jgi:hypothetical protein
MGVGGEKCVLAAILRYSAAWDRQKLDRPTARHLPSLCGLVSA